MNRSYASTPEVHAPQQHGNVFSYLIALALPVLWVSLTSTIVPLVSHWVRNTLFDRAVYREMTTVPVSDEQLELYGFGTDHSVYRSVYTNEELVKIVLGYLDHRAKHTYESDVEAATAAQCHVGTETKQCVSHRPVRRRWLHHMLSWCARKLGCVLGRTYALCWLTNRPFSHIGSHACEVAEMQLDVRTLSAAEMNATAEAEADLSQVNDAQCAVHPSVLSSNTLHREVLTTDLARDPRSTESVFYAAPPRTDNAKKAPPWVRVALTTFPPPQYRARIADGLHVRFIHRWVDYRAYGAPPTRRSDTDADEDGNENRNEDEEGEETSSHLRGGGDEDTSEEEAQKRDETAGKGAALRRWLSQAAARRAGDTVTKRTLRDVDVRAWRRCRRRRHGGSRHGAPHKDGVVYEEVRPRTNHVNDCAGEANDGGGYYPMRGTGGKGVRRAWSVEEQEEYSSDSNTDSGESRARDTDVDVMFAPRRRRERFTREEKLLYGPMLAHLGEGRSFGWPRVSSSRWWGSWRRRHRSLQRTIREVKHALSLHPGLSTVPGGCHNVHMTHGSRTSVTQLPFTAPSGYTDCGHACPRVPIPLKHVMQRQVIFEYHEGVWERLARWLWCSKERNSNKNSVKNSKTQTGKASDGAIDDFIASAVAWHRAQYRPKPTDRVRCVYVPRTDNFQSLRKNDKADEQDSMDDEQSSSKGAAVWKRNRAADKAYAEDEETADNVKPYLVIVRHKISAMEKGTATMDTLFFPRKAQLLQLLHDFAHGQGKYAVPGVSHSLTVLIHGPSGAGKTALAKAMAHWLKRDVVVLPCESRPIMRNLAFYVKGSTSLAPCDPNMPDGVSSTNSIWRASGVQLIDVADIDDCLLSRQMEPPDAVYLMEGVDRLGDDVDTNAVRCSSGTQPHDDDDDTEERTGCTLVTHMARALRRHSAPKGRVVLLTARDIHAVPAQLRHSSVISCAWGLPPLNPHTALDMMEHFFGTSLQPEPRARALSLLLSARAGVGRHAWMPDKWWHVCARYTTLEAMLDALTRDVMTGRPVVQEEDAF